MTTDIQSLRKDRGWSQEELADRAGLSVRTVQRLEVNGGGQMASFRSLAGAFDVPVQSITPNTLPRPLVPAHIAIWLGAILTLPSALFVLTNVIRFELGYAKFPDIFAPLLAIAWVDFLLPFLLIGGCLFAFVLNLAACIGLDTTPVKGAFVPQRFVLYGRFGNIVLLAAGLFLLVALVGYAILENLSHWIEAAA